MVFPDAAAKLYVTASPETRARRRALEIRERGAHIDEAAVLADMRRRDTRDFKPRRLAAAARSRRLLARHNRFGYRSRVPGGRRLREPQDREPPIGARPYGCAPICRSPATTDSELKNRRPRLRDGRPASKTSGEAEGGKCNANSPAPGLWNGQLRSRGS